MSVAFKRAVEILESTTGVAPERITEDLSLVEDLGVDSLDLVEISMELEAEFGVELDDDDLEQIKTVRDLTRKIERWQGDTNR